MGGFFAFYLAFFSVFVALADTPVPLLEVLPNWTIKYQGPASQQQFFKTSEVIKSHGLNRGQAIDVQSRYRKFLNVQTPDESFKAAVQVAKLFPNGPVAADKIAASDFVVAFDLDETLYDQYTAHAGCSTYDYVLPSGARRFIYLAPHADQILQKINAKGGSIVLFSANVDEPTRLNLKNWKVGDQSVLSIPGLAGVLYNSHLVRLSSDETFGPILEPSKDLRVLDESLEKVIIVDDNPVRLFQPRNHRLVKKFISSQYCGASEVVRRAFDQQLDKVWEEIESSVDFMRASTPKPAFADAYLPFSAIGQVAVRWLRDGNHWDEATAVEYIRRHPDTVDVRF